MRDLYIYYRAPESHADEILRIVRNMQQRLARQHGVVARLKRRPELRDGRHTWMEIYEAVPAGFEEVLECALAQEGLTGLIDGQRHTEIFMDASSCA